MSYPTARNYADDRRAVLAQMTADVREVNTANGWHDDARTFGVDIALLHSEVSEAFEAYRDHGLEDVTLHPDMCLDCGCPLLDSQHGVGYYDKSSDPKPRHKFHPAKPEGVGSELADVLIRLLDTADRAGIDLDAEYERKLAFNRTRGHKHGNKRL